MPVVLIILIAKTVLRISRLLGRGGGSALPGLIAERLDPHMGLRLAERLPHGCIVVTGTNGKTTTSKMLADMLTASGESLVINRSGSNLSRGIVSSLIEHVSVTGRFRQTMGVFEVDEAAMPAVAAMLQPKTIVVLNLFRDQLDRYGELDATAKLIGKGIAATNAKVFLNADDPLVAHLATYAKPENVQYFGVDAAKQTKLAHDVTADSNSCPVCGRALQYTVNYFGHIGRYECPRGHFSHPTSAYTAQDIVLRESDAKITMMMPDYAHRDVVVPLPGLYNVYNAVAALAAAIASGVSPDHAVQSLERVEPAFGRVEQVTYNGRTLYLLLVKNPTGFNQVIQTFLLRNKQQKVLIIINDNFADGRDVSWLWDVALEELVSRQHTLYVAGIRATDMALRLKYAEISVEYVESDITLALNHFVAQLAPGETGYVIPTYTAMLEARRRLSKHSALKGFWK